MDLLSISSDIICDGYDQSKLYQFISSMTDEEFDNYIAELRAKEVHEE